MCGGISGNDEPATPEVHELLQQVKDQVAGKSNASFEVFEPVAFRTQVVAGTNFFVKVTI